MAIAAGSIAVAIYLWLGPEALDFFMSPVPSDGDSWLRAKPDGDWSWSEWKRLPSEHFAMVPEGRQEEAFQRLVDGPVLLLDEAALADFWPEARARPVGLKPFLVRGVFLCLAAGVPMGTGQFFVYERHSDIMVHFGCLGRRRPGTKRAALVVWLPAQPKEVFVTCSMAE